MTDAATGRVRVHLRLRHRVLFMLALLGVVTVVVTACARPTEQEGPVIITVSAENEFYPFSDNLRGLAMNNWNWLWGGIAEIDSPRRLALIEAAKLAPRWNPQLAAVHARERERGHRNRATLAVARKLVAYLLAVDKSGQRFQERGPAETGAEADRPGEKRVATGGSDGKTTRVGEADFPLPRRPPRSRSDDLLVIQRPVLAELGTAQRSPRSRYAR